MDALLVIDVQQGLFGIPGFRIHEAEATVARIATLIARARENAAPVFFIQHDGGAGHPLASDSAGFPFRAELAPRPDEDVTVKRKCNAFQGTDLDAKLRAARIDHLVVCGMQTEYCVDTTVRAAFERGYRITLVADGHTTADTAALAGWDIVAHHNATLGGTFADVMPAAAVRFG